MRGSRRWAVAAAVAVPLLAGGCGSGDDSSDGSDNAKSPSASKSADEDASGGPGGGKDADGPDDGGTQGASSGGNGGSGGGSSSGGSGGGAGKDADVSPYQGTWSTKKAGSGDELLIMNIQRTSVSLIGDGVACQGSLKAAEKPASIELTCKNDSKKYAAGSVAEVDGKQLSVEWASERTTRFTKGMEMTVAPG